MSRGLAWASLLAGSAVAYGLLPRGWFDPGAAATWGVVGFAVVVALLARHHRAGWGARSPNRRIAALFVLGLPVVYVAGLLQSPEPSSLGLQWVGLALWAGLAVWGARRPRVLGVAALLHAVWDAYHLAGAGSLPAWYAEACVAADLGLGLFVLLSLVSGPPPSHPPRSHSPHSDPAPLDPVTGSPEAG